MATTSREPLTVITAAVPREHREALERMAVEGDRTISWLVRCAVRQYLHTSVGVEGGASLRRGASPDARGAA